MPVFARGDKHTPSCADEWCKVGKLDKELLTVFRRGECYAPCERWSNRWCKCDPARRQHGADFVLNINQNRPNSVRENDLECRYFGEMPSTADGGWNSAIAANCGQPERQLHSSRFGRIERCKPGASRKLGYDWLVECDCAWIKCGPDHVYVVDKGRADSMRANRLDVRHHAALSIRTWRNWKPALVADIWCAWRQCVTGWVNRHEGAERGSAN